MTNSKKRILRIGHLSTGYHSNFILMNSKKFSKELGVEVNWKLFGTGPAIIDAFRRKRLDLAYIGLPPALVGMDQGVKIKCIAGGHIEGTLLISKSKKFKECSELNGNLEKTLKQFKNQTIGVPREGSIHDVLINYIVDKFNLSDMITIKNYDQAELIALDMKNNKISAGVGTPSLAVFAQTLFDTQIIIPTDTFLSYNPSYGIVASLELIENLPRLIKIFLKHHKKASFMLRKHPMKAAKKISKSFEILDRKYLKKIISISPKYCIALSDGYLESTKQFIDIMYRSKYINNKLSINDVFYLDFIRKIHPERDHYFS